MFATLGETEQITGFGSCRELSQSSNLADQLQHPWRHLDVIRLNAYANLKDACSSRAVVSSSRKSSACVAFESRWAKLTEWSLSFLAPSELSRRSPREWVFVIAGV